MYLSDLQCRTAKPKDKTYKLADGDGLYLEVNPKGYKYWRFKYRMFDKEKRLAIGVYPEISLLEAREERAKARKALREFQDPSILKQERKQVARFKAAQTFELIAREWHAHYKTNWSDNYAKNILYRLELNLFPSIGHYPIDQLTLPMILTCLQKIESRGVHEPAYRALQYCGQIYRYAAVTGRVERNITVDLKGALKKYKKGHYKTIEIDDLPDLIKAINRNEARMFRQTVLLIKFMMLSFVRTKELVGARWSEFNFEKAQWIIPAERMKMRIAHLVPLAPQAIEILKELKELNGNSENSDKIDYVFPSIFRPNKPTSNGAILAALKNLKYGGKMTGHGFRSLAMTAIKQKLKYSHDIVDRQLAHLPPGKVNQAYDRTTYIPERIQMMKDWANYIDTLT